MQIFINILLFQFAWFSCVLGASKGNFWIGPLTVFCAIIIHLMMCDNVRGELLIIGATSVIGLIIDTGLTSLGVFSPSRHYVPSPWTPLWLFSMWPNFATLLNVSLRWMHNRYFLSICLGATGGAFAYYGGMQIGAITFQEPIIQSILILSMVWGALTPALLWIVIVTNKSLIKNFGNRQGF